MNNGVFYVLYDNMLLCNSILTFQYIVLRYKSILTLFFEHVIFNTINVYDAKYDAAVHTTDSCWTKDIVPVPFDINRALFRALQIFHEVFTD